MAYYFGKVTGGYRAFEMWNIKFQLYKGNTLLGTTYTSTSGFYQIQTSASTGSNTLVFSSVYMNSSSISVGGSEGSYQVNRNLDFTNAFVEAQYGVAMSMVNDHAIQESLNILDNTTVTEGEEPQRRGLIIDINEFDFFEDLSSLDARYTRKNILDWSSGGEYDTKITLKMNLIQGYQKMTSSPISRILQI